MSKQEHDHKKLDITPETKVGALLDAYPELEEVLISLSPTFKKLKNPVLRKTIAKVASLHQVAKVGDVSLGALINGLRAAVGMENLAVASGESSGNAGAPAWFESSKVVDSFDARPFIEKGQHPMGEVISRLGQLKSGQIQELITPFVPAPLIDMAKGKGYTAWSKMESSDLVRTYFAKEHFAV